MFSKIRIYAARAMAIAISFAVAEFASAATVSPIALNYSTTYNGAAIVTVSPSATVNALVVPGSYFYGNTYAAPTQNIPGSSNPPGYGFYDDYTFSITGASANSITSTIDFSNLLKITDLQERVYSLAGNSVPTLGVPNGTVYQSWSAPIGNQGTVAIINNLILTPGSYVLEIRGNATGAFGGSYSGSLNLAAVPLPAALPLLLSSLSLLGGAVRRRVR